VIQFTDGTKSGKQTDDGPLRIEARSKVTKNLTTLGSLIFLSDEIRYGNDCGQMRSKESIVEMMSSWRGSMVADEAKKAGIASGDMHRQATKFDWHN